MDDFSSTSAPKNQISSNKPSVSSSSERNPSSKFPNTSDDSDPLSQIDEEYVAQLAADMEDFVKRLEDGEDLSEDLKRAFQGLMNLESDNNDNNRDESTVNNNNNSNINNINGKPTGSSTSSSFQDKINQTLNKLQDSSNQLDVCVFSMTPKFN